MALTSSTIQTQIAFKNLLGKSQTDSGAGILNESIGIFFNVSANSVWLDTINATPSVSILQGTTVQVVADLATISVSNGHGYTTKWPTTVPSGIDIKTGLSFSYGSGSLSGISAGDFMNNIISDSYGGQYISQPYTSYSSGPISTTDNRNWVYQYNSGVFYQDVTTYTPPTKIVVYPYIGNKLNIGSNQNLIRLSATGSNSYYATVSNPMISTYSTSYVYLVDFANANTSGTVSINIDLVGTQSVYKYEASGLVNLNPSDITVGTIYYLTYNPNISSFIFYKNNPAYVPSSYVSPSPTVNTVGGISNGTSFVSTTVNDVIDDLLYPERLGNIISFTNNQSPVALGSTVSSGTVFTWVLSNTSSFVTNSITIEDVTSGPYSTSWPTGGVLSTGLSSSLGSYTYGVTSSSSIPRSRDIKMSIRRTNGTIISKISSITFGYNVYWVSTTYSVLPLTASLFTGSYTYNNSIYQYSNFTGDFVIGSTYATYKYLVSPSTFTVSNILYKTLPVALDNTDVYTWSSGDMTYQQINFTDTTGVTNTYNVYKTSNLIGGTFTMTINK